MEKTGKKISHVTGVLARSVRIIIENILREGGALQEIRMRIGQPLTVMIDGEEQILPLKERAHIVTKEEIKETIEYMSRYSLYAYENELRQGFLTLEGGHRVGVAGKVIVDRGKVKNIQYISSLNIRIAHEVIGCADELIPYITKNKKVCHTLIISPPRCGKTTLLRDLIRQISDGNEYVKGCSVGVVDERSEIGGCYMGIVQNNLGMRTDVLDCCPKAEGMIMLIRSMSPQVVAVDEIGTAEDIHKILIKEPGTFLGSFEKDISDRAMEMYLNKMDLEIEKLRAELASKVKVGRCLGVMAGLFFIVLLI